MQIYGVVEGDTDEVILNRITNYVGLEIIKIYKQNGKEKLLRNINAYNNAANHYPWIVLIDLDMDYNCAPNCLRQWIPEPAPNMYCRIAVRSIESWLLADRERFALWAGIRIAQIPENPDSLENPKRDLVNLVRSSRKPRLRNDIIPKEGSHRNVGPGYTSRIIDFIENQTNGWRPEIALQNSDSLRRCIRALQQLTRIQS